VEATNALAYHTAVLNTPVLSFKFYSTGPWFEKEQKNNNETKTVAFCFLTPYDAFTL